jgi:hypothetical protein
MSATIRCRCGECAGEYDDVQKCIDDHPGREGGWLVEVDGRPYTASLQSIQQMFDWDEPL